MGYESYVDNKSAFRKMNVEFSKYHPIKSVPFINAGLLSVQFILHFLELRYIVCFKMFFFSFIKRLTPTGFRGLFSFITNSC